MAKKGVGVAWAVESAWREVFSKKVMPRPSVAKRGTSVLVTALSRIPSWNTRPDRSGN